MRRLLLLLILAAPLAFGQATTDIAAHIRWGTTLPTSCTPNNGDIFFKTSATIGAYECLSANTWTAFATGSGGSPGGSNGNLQYRVNGTTFGGTGYVDTSNSDGNTVSMPTGPIPQFFVNASFNYPFTIKTPHFYDGSAAIITLDANASLHGGQLDFYSARGNDITTPQALHTGDQLMSITNWLQTTTGSWDSFKVGAEILTDVYSIDNKQGRMQMLLGTASSGAGTPIYIYWNCQGDGLCRIGPHIRGWGIPGGANDNGLTADTDSTLTIEDKTQQKVTTHFIRAGSAQAASVSPVIFTGSGLQDAISGGTYSGTATNTYTVIIDATGTPDTFKWQKNVGAFTTGVSITGAAQTLTDGVTITFAATTGHTLTDQWVIAGRYQTDLTQWQDSSKAVLSRIQYTGAFQNLSVAFSSLGTPAAGTQIYCSDCQVTTVAANVVSDATCKNGGGGALAVRIGGAWKCTYTP